MRASKPARAALVVFVQVVLVLSTGCGSARRSAPLVGPFVAQNQAERSGERTFFEFCHQCHPGGDAGLGPALNDKPLPALAIRAQVRAGVGAMPAFEEDRIKDAELDDLVAYVLALRKHGNAD